MQSNVDVSRFGSVKQNITNLIVVLGIIICWVSSAELARLIQTEDDYDKPYFLTWILLSLNSVCFPIFLGVYNTSLSFRQQFGIPTTNTSNGRVSLQLVKEFGRECMVDAKGVALSRRKIFTYMGMFAVLWFSNMYFYYRALSLVDVSIVICVWNSSCVFVYLLSVYVLGDTFSWVKMASVVLCFAGVILIAISNFIPWRFITHAKPQMNHFDSESLVLGSVMSLLSGLSYAFFIVFSKKAIGSGPSEVLACSIAYSLQGIFSFFILSPGLLFMHVTGAESFSLPNGGTTTLIFILIQLISFLMNAFFVFGNAVTNPLFVSVASMLTIPVGAVTDYVLHNSVYSEWQVLGTIAIICGFTVLSWPSVKSSDLEILPVEEMKETLMRNSM